MKQHKRESSAKQMFKAFLATPTGIISGLILLGLTVLVIMGPNGFGEQAVVSDMARSSEGPSAEFRFGTDALGRDIFTRTLAATRLSILYASAAVLFAMVVGGLIGGLIAAGGPRVRRVGATVIDTMMGFGDILLAVVVVAIVGVGAKGAVLAIGVAFTPHFARFTYSLVDSVMVRDYMSAAQVVGVSRSGIGTRYVGRNVADSLVIVTFTTVAEGIMAMSSLSFLGLGIQSPQFDWGQMLTDGVKNFYLNPYAALVPAVLILITGLAVNLFGDALARAVNPVLWNERPSLFRSKFRRSGAASAAIEPEITLDPGMETETRKGRP
ncbi:ABC transporter permease [Aeromicrobium choanae]|uniref:ABC-type dipeptide/oligopeptide/nickel transport system, permease component n=1 Tax=Aeromicrobium choanae TaxID=1736691 RepID=A0A1T4YUP7_9ACTN|nr:ABC transporter permease [Aeromicrobium choanae]SKB05470.1 ABC-type dipeptide/oligopeptide/nickel transport system, permease component [Aeromicrobium choanae]